MSEIITDDDDELRRIFATLEKFICHMYGVPNSSNVNDVCFYLFSKNLSIKELDDNFERNVEVSIHRVYHHVKAELYQHLLRGAVCDKVLEKCSFKKSIILISVSVSGGS
ncbi:hypothetical protein TNCV_1060651 [Trichonephila clavipes]|nr:hypothetical protein TNCV_1060651 [Trichonephila clavipes]